MGFPGIPSRMLRTLTMAVHSSLASLCHQDSIDFHGAGLHECSTCRAIERIFPCVKTSQQSFVFMLPRLFRDNYQTFFWSGFCRRTGQRVDGQLCSASPNAMSHFEEQFRTFLKAVWGGTFTARAACPQFLCLGRWFDFLALRSTVHVLTRDFWQPRSQVQPITFTHHFPV